MTLKSEIKAHDSYARLVVNRLFDRYLAKYVMTFIQYPKGTKRIGLKMADMLRSLKFDYIEMYNPEANLLYYMSYKTFRFTWRDKTVRLYIDDAGHCIRFQIDQHNVYKLVHGEDYYTWDKELIEQMILWTIYNSSPVIQHCGIPRDAKKLRSVLLYSSRQMCIDESKYKCRKDISRRCFFDAERVSDELFVITLRE